ncbi:MAG TPA: molybdate ABC transporter substrate-binding protein [Gaiellaceae bacterium]
MKRLLLLFVTTCCLLGAAAASAASPVTVFAAASLTDVFPRIAPAARYSFGGSNTLAAQVRQGAPADVFASANTALPWQLYRDGLVARPVVFTRNALVLIVPRSNPARIHSVFDLRADGTRLVVAAAAVPVGGYTRQALQKLGLSSVLQNVVSEETDVREVLAKVALGEADAGFVYATDAKTVPGKVRVFALPAGAQPVVAYAMAVVSSSPQRAAAQAFVQQVLSKAGQAKLRAAGFLARRR